jgi:F0F1-type ATP synthase epsilon subunit
VRGRRIEKAKRNGRVKVLQDLVDELHNALCETEEDLDYRMCILNGSWPQAVEILTRSLEKAKEIEQARELKETEEARSRLAELRAVEGLHDDRRTQNSSGATG